MASIFDTMMGSVGVDALMSTLGDAVAVKYRVAGVPGATVELTAIWSELPDAVDEDAPAPGSGRVRRRQARCIVTRDPDSAYGGVAEPRSDAQIVRNGEAWDVVHFERRGEALVTLIVQRIVPLEVTAPGYRRAV